MRRDLGFSNAWRRMKGGCLGAASLAILTGCTPTIEKRTIRADDPIAKIEYHQVEGSLPEGVVLPPESSLGLTVNQAVDQICDWAKGLIVDGNLPADSRLVYASFGDHSRFDRAEWIDFLRFKSETSFTADVTDINEPFPGAWPLPKPGLWTWRLTEKCAPPPRTRDAAMSSCVSLSESVPSSRDIRVQTSSYRVYLFALQRDDQYEPVEGGSAPFVSFYGIFTTYSLESRVIRREVKFNRSGFWQIENLRSCDDAPAG